MTLAEIDARIARTEQQMERANGEWYAQLVSDLAAYRAMRARMETTTPATITRYRIPQRTGRFAWYYGYSVELNGQTHSFGRFPLASIRRWCRQHGATEIVEAWK